MKFPGSTESKITKDKNGENVSHLKITEIALVHCNILSNDYQQNSRILLAFVPNKSFVQLEIPATNFIVLKRFNSQSFVILKCGLQTEIVSH